MKTRVELVCGCGHVWVEKAVKVGVTYYFEESQQCEECGSIAYEIYDDEFFADFLKYHV